MKLHYKQIVALMQQGTIRATVFDYCMDNYTVARMQRQRNTGFINVYRFNRRDNLR